MQAPREKQNAYSSNNALEQEFGDVKNLIIIYKNFLNNPSFGFLLIPKCLRSESLSKNVATLKVAAAYLFLTSDSTIPKP